MEGHLERSIQGMVLRECAYKAVNLGEAYCSCLGFRGAPVGDAPPAYDHSSSRPTGPEKGGAVESDEAIARRLQAEENQRAQGAGSTTADRGQADSYYNNSAPYSQSGSTGQAYGQSGSSGQVYGQQTSPQTTSPQDGKKGLLGKVGGLLGGKLGGSRPPQQAYGQQSYGHQGYGQQGYGQYPPQQGYGGYPPQQGYGGYAAPAAAPPRRSGLGGMGALGGAGLGVGAGLLGGVLLGEAMEDHHGGDDGNYGDDGGNYGGDGGYGGGDGGGFGGDDGGGFDGGDGGGGDF
ncbi:hypothetical protein AMS68_007040 [Peltaster fructicola]|uniref:Uncharacterized protein n=1 Tax=Peltaster fructicola TaxID=286661 RepID=A0A6H0Y3E1_9PEZI|nr:hypothetical protein AMS68_007040 [Peltaster fructicola]